MHKTAQTKPHNANIAHARRLAWITAGIAVTTVGMAAFVPRGATFPLETQMRKTLSELSADNQIKVALGGIVPVTKMVGGTLQTEYINGAQYKIVLVCPAGGRSQENIIREETLRDEKPYYINRTKQGRCAAVPGF